jgi:hypothetical protein
MEVHAHTHPSISSGHRKKWTHYLWEFLMLFLAVTLGFLVENLREHFVENKRAKEFAILLYNDLKSDTSYLKQMSEAQLLNLNEEDSLIDLLKSNRYIGNNYFFVDHYNKVATLLFFKPAFPVNFEQAKNSGSLRYFKSIELISTLSGLNRHLDEITAFFQSRNDFILQYLTPWIIQNMNTLQFDIFTRKVLSENPVVNDLNNRTVLPLINKINLTKTWGLFIIEYLKQALDKTNKTIEILKKEYHVE